MTLQKNRNIMHSNFNLITHTWQGSDNQVNLYRKKSSSYVSGTDCLPSSHW